MLFLSSALSLWDPSNCVLKVPWLFFVGIWGVHGGKTREVVASQRLREILTSHYPNSLMKTAHARWHLSHSSGHRSHDYVLLRRSQLSPDLTTRVFSTDVLLITAAWSKMLVRCLFCNRRVAHQWRNPHLAVPSPPFSLSLLHTHEYLSAFLS